MKSKTVIKVDLAHSSYVPMVEAIQGDGGTRCVSIQLLDDGKPWLPPEKSDIAVVYTQPGGKKGFYNKLPDGSTAISVCGSTVTAILAPNILSVAGEVHAALVFNNNQLDQLSTFPFSIMVAKNQFAGAQEAEDYIRLQWLEDKLEERIIQLISTEECVRAGAAAHEADAAAAAAQESAATAENAASSANDAAGRADDAASGANAAAASAQAVVDGIVPEVNQLKEDLAAITPDDAAIDGKPWTSRKIVDSLCQPFEETGNPVQCYPVENYPLEIKVRIEPKQEGSGAPSLDNIRPITGLDSLRVTRCGKNLLNILEKAEQAGTINQDSYNVSENTVTMFSEQAGSWTALRLLYSFPKGRYTIKANVRSTDPEYHGCLSIYRRLISGGKSEPLFTITSKVNSCSVYLDEGYYLGLYFHLTTDEGISTARTVEYTDVSVEPGDGTSSYEPYCGDSLHIALPEMVYGGELDLRSGVLKKTWDIIQVYNGESLPGEWISDRDVYALGTTPTVGAQVAYKLAEPSALQVNPQEIADLPGVNTVYADSGIASVAGRESPQHTIQQLLSRVAALETMGQV